MYGKNKMLTLLAVKENEDVISTVLVKEIEVLNVVNRGILLIIFVIFYIY